MCAYSRVMEVEREKKRYGRRVGRMLRSDLQDGVFHITVCGAGGTRVFITDLDRVEFLRGLDVTIDRTSWKLLVYCLMGTHYHLLIEAKAATLPAAMRWLNGVYSRRFNKRHNRRGHLWGARYDVWLLRDQRHFDATVKYILNNPVRAGLCEHAQDWQWSYAAEDVGGLAAAA
jgi:REP-associated tyrosine transposase